MEEHERFCPGCQTESEEANVWRYDGIYQPLFAAIFSKAAGVELVPVFFKSSPEIATLSLEATYDLAPWLG